MRVEADGEIVGRHASEDDDPTSVSSCGHHGLTTDPEPTVRATSCSNSRRDRGPRRRVRRKREGRHGTGRSCSRLRSHLRGRSAARGQADDHEGCPPQSGNGESTHIHNMFTYSRGSSLTYPRRWRNLPGIQTHRVAIGLGRNGIVRR
jgi:hypothetical protein